MLVVSGVAILVVVVVVVVVVVAVVVGGGGGGGGGGVLNKIFKRVQPQSHIMHEGSPGLQDSPSLNLGQHRPLIP